MNMSKTEDLSLKKTGEDGMNTEYRKAKPEEADRVCYIVQHTKEIIYPGNYSVPKPKA